MSAGERRREIMNILEGRRFETIANLAFHFGKSIRTIKYDIAALIDAREPIETQPSKGGGVRIARDYRAYKGDVSEEQQTLLVSLMKGMNAHDSRLIRELLRSHGSRKIRDQIEGDYQYE
jgi:predicted DNA-binding transcriptional regulator YafY